MRTYRDAVEQIRRDAEHDGDQQVIAVADTILTGTAPAQRAEALERLERMHWFRRDICGAADRIAQGLDIEAVLAAEPD